MKTTQIAYATAMVISFWFVGCPSSGTPTLEPMDAIFSPDDLPSGEVAQDIADMEMLEGQIDTSVGGEDTAIPPRCTGDEDCIPLANPPCVLSHCDKEKGECVTEFASNGTPCDDKNACTGGDRCVSGKCLGALEISCDDHEVCTDDSCDSGKGCVNTPNTAQCDDHDPCTYNDQCKDGKCIGERDPNCVCASDEDCKRFDDNDLCNGYLICVSGQCVLDKRTIVVCDTSQDNECYKTVCKPDTGKCEPVYAEDGTPCDDKDICTPQSECRQGQCVGIGRIDCDDHNLCTDDFCVPAIGCVYKYNSLSCDDGNACTLGDRCSGGRCFGTILANCDDQNPCTDDLCDPTTGCYHNFNNAPCDDGNACTTGDTCSMGQCVSGAPLVCDDLNVCTDDFCDPKRGCVYVPNTNPCDDNNVCTLGDSCVDGRCVGGALVDCDDGNVCTDDLCDPLTGCYHLNNQANCEDGDMCTVQDTCSGGKCQPGTPRDCTDNNVCTVDSCDSKVGCVYLWAPEGTACDDQNACTVNDRCTEGKCVGEGLVCDDNNPCTRDLCDNTAQGCYSVPDDTLPCDDKNPCTLQDHCVSGACVGGTPKDCSDNNDCTEDYCNEQTGECLHRLLPDGTACSDHNPCTENDKCVSGKCTGTIVSCDDNNSCTSDTCDPVTGQCVHTALPDGTGCSDNDPCTRIDTCQQGQCVGSDIDPCDDNNVCTRDYCEQAVGCMHEPLTGTSCDDGNLCNGEDVCDNGQCKHINPLNCDDKNPCTQDSCDPQHGCINVPLDGVLCSDNNACTQNDVCKAGVCVGEPVNCDDNNICTTDTCDRTKGCLHTDNTLPCNDGNYCTENDTCRGGQCQGTPVNCDDGNPCTDESCYPQIGCVYSPVTSVFRVCGGSFPNYWTCISGVCSDWSNGCRNDQNGAIRCYDGNPCTNDRCREGQCRYPPPSNVTQIFCTDSNACTAPDRCTNQRSCAGTAISCDDANDCTLDACDTRTGCTYTKVQNGLPCQGGQCWFGVCLPL